VGGGEGSVWGVVGRAYSRKQDIPFEIDRGECGVIRESF